MYVLTQSGVTNNHEIYQKMSAVVDKFFKGHFYLANAFSGNLE